MSTLTLTPAGMLLTGSGAVYRLETAQTGDLRITIERDGHADVHVWFRADQRADLATTLTADRHGVHGRGMGGDSVGGIRHGGRVRLRWRSACDAAFIDECAADVHRLGLLIDTAAGLVTRV